MTIFVVTDNQAIVRAFRRLEKGHVRVVPLPAGSYRSAQTRFLGSADAFFYFDVAELEPATVTRRARSLCDVRPFRFGVIDVKGSVTDVAHLFHLSAADYVGRGMLKRINPARFRRVMGYEPELVDETEEMAPPQTREWTPSGDDWSQVTSGDEYTFLMLYAGLDHAADMRKKASENSLRTIRTIFQGVLERHFAPYGGRLWMWKEDDGLLLLPFDGKSVDGIIAALRLAVNRSIIQCEEFGQFEPPSWRLAFHIGNTVYRTTGSTGDIVSEDINFVFHLGGRYLDSGDVALAGDCRNLVPPMARRYFEHRGRFESVEVYTLRPLD
jgi:hypothetical protein